MILAMGFGIRLRSRLLRLRDLPVRGGQVALGLRDILPRLRQVGLRLRERLGRRIKTSPVGLDVLLRLRQLGRIIPQRGVGRVDGRLVRLDVRLRGFKLFRRGRLSSLIRGDILPRLIELGRIVLQRRLIVSQVFLDLFDLFRRDSRSHRHRGDCRPVGTITSMIDSTERICVRRASRQTSNHIIADTGRDGRDLLENTISQTFAENIPIPIDRHGTTISGLPIPSNRNHAQLGRKNRLGWDRRRRRILGDSQREHTGPFAHLIGIRWNGTHSDKNLNTAIQIRPR